VLIMTSNLGSQAIQEGTKKNQDLSPATLHQIQMALKAHFRPEFLNRIDDTVIFEPLHEEHIERVVDLQLVHLYSALKEKRMTLELTPAAKKFLAGLGYDPQYGARPLKRAVQRYIVDPLAMKILSGDFVPGNKISVDVKGDALEIGAVLK
jgi:ATP-dependent Clp protease ATP-binding subunit ClpB